MQYRDMVGLVAEHNAAIPDEECSKAEKHRRVRKDEAQAEPEHSWLEEKVDQLAQRAY